VWFKVDDKLHDHRKARKAGKAAMGVWVLAGSWSMDNDTDGFIPDDVLTRWGTETDARALIRVGLWSREEFQGEWGYRFHDWSRFQPSAAVTAAKKAAEAEAGLRGNHKRWHVDRGISDPDCEYCYRVPDQEPDGVPDRVGIGVPESGANRPVPEPDPVPHVSPNGETKSAALALVDRDDIREVCDHLADRIAEDGSKRPAIGKGWLDSARLMLDRDGRSVEEIHAAIDWCQNHHFWRANILSMPKLREKFDQLRKQAIAERTQPATSRNSEFQAQQERAMARAIERERQMGIR
jgi:hypothetical protein